MKRHLKDLKPTVFGDIIAMGALYRPGPMANIPKFIAGKNDPKSISYMHPKLEPILKETYGVMVFQEQVVALLQLLAGYKPGEADLVRKAIGKKDRSIMASEKPRFIEGCKQQGLSDKEAEKIWDQIQPCVIILNKAIQLLRNDRLSDPYLKANYPTAFMAALMSSDFDDIDRLAIEISECKAMGIDVLPPDVNESFGEFAVIKDKDGEKIRFGMSAIKNVGTGAVEEIIRARDEVGEFSGLESFLSTVNVRSVNRKAIESLAKAGALDGFNDNREVIVANLDNLTAFAARQQKDILSGQTDLFGGNNGEGGLKIKLALDPALADTHPRQKIIWERELSYLSFQHP